mmetsp:Transcript_12549/g.18776  ORF Transcript_12549/g.18776 Transcript_12549/m.18776 type:complete len:127 (-) Transcript_12549:155-535(-)
MSGYPTKRSRVVSSSRDAAPPKFENFLVMVSATYRLVAPKMLFLVCFVMLLRASILTLWPDSVAVSAPISMTMPIEIVAVAPKDTKSCRRSDQFGFKQTRCNMATTDFDLVVMLIGLNKEEVYLAR